MSVQDNPGPLNAVKEILGYFSEAEKSILDCYHQHMRVKTFHDLVEVLLHTGRLNGEGDVHAMHIYFRVSCADIICLAHDLGHAGYKVTKSSPTLKRECGPFTKKRKKQPLRLFPKEPQYISRSKFHQIDVLLGLYKSL